MHPNHTGPHHPSRRAFLQVGLSLAALPTSILLLPASAQDAPSQDDDAAPASPDRRPPTEFTRALKVQYLEIVTKDVDATCATLARLHGVTFSDPVGVLGGARTAPLPGGGWLGVRGPLSPTEVPVVRPYVLVDDIEAAVAAAEAAGAEIAHPPLLLEGYGTFAIYFLGGNEHGLWQV